MMTNVIFIVLTFALGIRPLELALLVSISSIDLPFDFPDVPTKRILLSQWFLLPLLINAYSQTRIALANV